MCVLVSCCAQLSRRTSRGEEGSGCTMHPLVRDDCERELYSSLLLQRIPKSQRRLA